MPRTIPHRLRIALIGPMSPYRGGIAHYTSQLRSALSQACDLVPVSFSRQYPSWLYPGESDIEPGSGDSWDADVAYLLDACSPGSLRRAAMHIARSGCDAAVVSWWTLFWAPGMAYTARLLRKNGIPTIYLCHNVADHGASAPGRFAMRLLLRGADAYIVHSAEQQQALQHMARGRPVLHLLHPVYRHFPSATSTPARRGRLELLFFGFIRPYKGLDVLLKALELLQDQDVHVTIAGEPWEEEVSLRRRLAQYRVPNLELRPGYLEASEAAELFARADIVVLPYLDATGSGVASLAYHYSRPVLASRVGGLVDAVIDGVTGWLVDAGDPAALAAALARLTRENAGACRPHIEEFCRVHSWEAMAGSICELAGKLAFKQEQIPVRRSAA